MDLIGVVEAAYRLEGNLQSWVEGIGAVAPVRFDTGYFVHSFVSGPERFDIVALAQVGGSPHSLQQAAAVNTVAPQMGTSLFQRRSPVVSTVSERDDEALGGDLPERFARGTDGAVRDIWGFQWLLGNGRGVGLFSLLAQPRVTSARERRLWPLLGAHLGAGLRLRARLRDLSLDDDNVEAILERGGARVADARGEARDQTALAVLREQARSVERARTRGGDDDGEQALMAWRGLVDGRWSLVDHHDSDGRRYIVARRNEPHVCDPRGLTRRERAVARLLGRGLSSKQIAYALGLSEATISAEVKAAVRKLDLRGTPELALLFAPDAIPDRIATLDLGATASDAEQLAVLSMQLFDEQVLASLSEAERAVALQLAQGATYAHVAAQRETSLRTVANQAAGIFRKIGVSSRVELAARLGGAGQR